MPEKIPDMFDICIIGAGSAGLSVAAGAAQLGLKTALIERGDMGGDCLNTGCVPSKALLYAAKIAQTSRHAEKLGIKNHAPEIDFSAVKDHVFGVINAIAPNDSQARFEKLGVTVIRDRAVFTGENSVIAGGRPVTARYFVIATGSSAALPPIPGLERDKILTNENIFALYERPDHLVIIGGGPIGIEMAMAHRRLGSKVTVVDIATILPKDDPELVSILRRLLKDEGIDILEGARIERIAHGDRQTTVFAEHDGKKLEITGSHLLVAAGRQPNVEGLDLEKAGVEFNRRGIKTDARLRTTNKRIFAAGDVAGGPQFTHIAGYHAGIILRNIAFKIPAGVDYTALPWVTYTDPELANVGMTEVIAVEKHGRDKIKTVSWPFRENDRAVAEHRTQGMIKVTALSNGKILGAAILGPGAGEMIGLWGLALQKNMELSDIAATLAPYPTLGEISKRVAGAWYTPQLFSDRTRKLVGLLKRLPF